jgi:hypothetical protein
MTRRLLLLCVVASLVPVLALAVPASGAVSPNLVLRYAFTADRTAVVHDSSLRGLDGTLVNADPAAAFVAGAPGRGRGLQLVASGRQYVAVPQSSALDVDRFTLAAWVRYTGATTPETLGRWEILEKAGAYWLNLRTNGQLRAGGFFGGCGASRYWRFFDSTRTIARNTWTHVAATYDGAKLVIYVNGQRSGVFRVTGATCANDEPLAVGAKNAPAKGILEAFWDGRLDEVRVYDRALAQAQVARLAATP